MANHTRQHVDLSALSYADALAQISGAKSFCRQMAFDLCYFPGITDKDANPKLDPAVKPPKYGKYNYTDLPDYKIGRAHV